MSKKARREAWQFRSTPILLMVTKAHGFILLVSKPSTSVCTFPFFPGEVVSVETQNELLSLLAHYGLGNPWMIGKTRLPHRKGTSPREGPSPQEGTSSREGTSPREGPSPREGTSHREGPSPRDAQEDQPREEEQLDTKSDSDSECTFLSSCSACSLSYIPSLIPGLLLPLDEVESIGTLHNTV